MEEGGGGQVCSSEHPELPASPACCCSLMGSRSIGDSEGMLKGPTQRELTDASWPCLLVLSKRTPIAQGLGNEPEGPERSQRLKQPGHGTAGRRGVFRVPPFDFCLYKENLIEGLTTTGQPF